MDIPPTKKKVVITFLDEVPENKGVELGIDPIKALRGCAKGSNLTKKMLKSRREDIGGVQPQRNSSSCSSVDWGSLGEQVTQACSLTSSEVPY